MLDKISSDNINLVFDRISLLEDMKTEWDQKCIFHQYVKNAITLESSFIVS